MKYIVDLMAIRREVEWACNQLINDRDIADKVYRSIISPLEDMIVDDCEVYEGE